MRKLRFRKEKWPILHSTLNGQTGTKILVFNLIPKATSSQYISKFFKAFPEDKDHLECLISISSHMLKLKLTEKESGKLEIWQALRIIL